MLIDKRKDGASHLDDAGIYSQITHHDIDRLYSQDENPICRTTAEIERRHAEIAYELQCIEHLGLGINTAEKVGELRALEWVLRKKPS